MNPLNLQLVPVKSTKGNYRYNFKASSDKRASWAIVHDGVVAEFCVTSDKLRQLFQINILKLEIAEGQLKPILDNDLEAVVAESAYHQSTQWIKTSTYAYHTHLFPHTIKNRMRFPALVPEHLCMMIQLDFWFDNRCEW